MLSLISYWQPIAAAFAAFALSFLIHTVDVNRIEANQREALAIQKDTLIRQCTTNLQKLERANDELQKSLASNAARDAKSKRLHPTQSVLPRSSVAKLPAGGAGYAGQNGAVAGTSDDFRDFAHECNDYRTEIIAIGKTKEDYNMQLKGK